MKSKLEKKIKILDANTTPLELLQEGLINFFYGFAGNSIVVFMTNKVDIAILLNFVVYYSFLSFIVNRKRYETYLGKFVVLPGAAALGAFTGYKVANIISTLFI